VDLASFTVQGSPAGNVLHWTTAAGEATGSFVIQRSADGLSWQDLTTIAADAGQASYAYADAAR
jgi:hypothetical protein